jgi:hypothetical protein
MTLFQAFLLGVVIVWAMHSSDRQQARLWRIDEALSNRQWWYVLDLSPACQVGPGHIYAALFRLERLGRVERETALDGRARYRLRGTDPAEVDSGPA